jgi:hypothetical protein
MVIVGLLQNGNLELPILARRRRVTTERSMARPKFCDREMRSVRLHSFSVQDRSVTAHPVLPLSDGLFADDAVNASRWHALLHGVSAFVPAAGICHEAA